MKALLLLFFAIFLIPNTYAQLWRKKREAVEQTSTVPSRDGHHVIYGKDRPHLGYPDSVKVEEGTYVDNRKEGEWVKYHRDGKTPKLIGTYAASRPSGRYRKFYATGVLREEGYFMYNRYFDTLWRYHPNGKLEFVAFYNQNGKEHGKVQYFHDNGQPEFTYYANNGQPVDSSFCWDRDGKLLYSGSGGRVGLGVNTYQDITYANGDTAAQPVFTSFPSDEKAPQLVDPPLTSGVKFNPEGYNKVYNEDNEIWQDGFFRAGSLWDGKVYVYDPDGILVKIKVYKNGVYHSEAQI